MAQISQLQKENVIPDVLPESASPSLEIIVKWPEAILDMPGKELDREATQPEPTIHISPASGEKHNDYVLIMTDPDLMATNDGNFGQVRHWLATNVSINDEGQVIIPESGVVSSYIGPAPLPNYIAPRPHRYVFILARPAAGGGLVNIEKEDLRALQQDYPSAFEGPQDQQDLKDRWGFNAQKLLKQKKLNVEAATFMLVGGTIKSAADNIAMTAQAGVNKVMGQ